MKLLLDTHALLWWLSDDDRLGACARDMVADPDNTVLVSVVSLWEIVIELRIGKLDANIVAIKGAMGRDGIGTLGISATHLVALATLPTHHRDPFDHLLIAQAIAEDAVFLSGDRHVPDYPVRFVTCAA